MPGHDGPNIYFCLCAGLGCAMFGLAGIMSRSGHGKNVFGLFAILQTMLAGTAAFLGQPHIIVIPSVVLAIMGFWLWGSKIVALMSRHCWAAVRHPRCPWVVLIVASPIVTIGWMELAQNSQPFGSQAMGIITSNGEAPEDALPFRAYTDNDRPLYLFPCRESLMSETEQGLLEVNFLRRWGLEGRLLRLESPHDSSNCHGWVFTGGKYNLNGPDVEIILRDNGYNQVAVPNPADLVVYRDRQGVVMHSGLVHSHRSPQAVLVESKWGHLGRFLHAVDVYRFYGAQYTFYRSPRTGHLLRGLDQKPLARAG